MCVKVFLYNIKSSNLLLLKPFPPSKKCNLNNNFNEETEACGPYTVASTGPHPREALGKSRHCHQEEETLHCKKQD